MIAGPPAAGKGTQCARIVDRWGLVHISAGDLLRAEVAAGTPAGAKAKAFMDAGRLVPNEVVVDMVKSRLAAPDAVERGWLLDGYPRSAEQADAIEGAGVRPDLFLLLDVPDDTLVARVTGRRTDPETGEIYHLDFKPPPAEIVPRLVQRSDDTEEALRARLETHHANVAAVVGFYTDVLVTIDGSGSMDDVFGAVEAAVEGVAGGVPQEAAA
jgi:adenylate kinase